MARSFASASTQYLSAAASLSNEPLTIAGWAYPLQTNQTCIVAGLFNSSGADGRFVISLNSSGNAVAGKENDAGTTLNATSANSYTANQWSHLCGRFTSNTSREIILNGDFANKGTALTTDLDDPTIDKAAIGVALLSTPAGPMNGRVACVAIWNVALSDRDIANLYRTGIGADPRSVRPDALVAYWPLLDNDGDQDYWANFHLTATNSPTYAKHPPVLMRSRPKHVVIGATSGAPAISSVTITGARTVSNTLTANVVTSPGTVDSIAYQWEISDDGGDPPTNGADLTGETAATLALTYADFASRLDANGEAYVRVGAIATVGAESSAESFSDWVRVTAGGSGVVRPIGQSVYISV